MGYTIQAAKDSVSGILATFCLMLVLGSCVSAAERRLAERYYNIASDYYADKNYPKAVSYYELALAEDPNLKVLYLNYGLALLEVQNYSEAERQLLRAYAIDQRNTLSLSALAYLNFRAKKYAAAVDWYRKSIEINEYNPQTYYNIGIVEQYMKNYVASQQAFDQAAELQPPKDLPVEMRRFAALNALYLGEEEQALRLYDEYFALNGESEEIFEDVHDFYKQKELYQKIIEVFASFEESLSGKALPAFLLARLYYLELDDPVLGETNLKAAIERGFRDQKRLDGVIRQLRGDVRKAAKGLLETQSNDASKLSPELSETIE